MTFSIKKYFASFLLLAGLLSSCEKDFLDRYPKDELTEETAFKTYDNFKTYSWSLYDQVGGYGDAVYLAPIFKPEYNSDNLSQTVAGGMTPYGYQNVVIPASGGNTFSPVTAQWDFSYLRRVNIMLDNIDKSSLTQADKDHWRSVGYFFHAYRYYDLLAAFGDVSWIDHVLSDNSPELYTERSPRDVVAQNILKELTYAEAHIKADGDGANTINTNVVRALISRFGLFEGTWRKYHGLANADTYLQASKNASEKLIAAFPAIMSSYDDVFNTEDLSGKPGIILFKQYAANLTANALPRYAGSTSWNLDVTKDAVESYLCTDGKPIATSARYASDANMYDEFRNRDRRLYYTVVPPYKVKVGAPNSTWSKTNVASEAEYINLMTTIGGTNKSLPMYQWSTSMQSGMVIGSSPHFRSSNGGQPQAVSELGYFFWKYYNRMPLDAGNNSTNDAPVFRIEEVMLNYAEVMFELNGFTQTIANNTINKLRTRANVAPMMVGEINASFDPKRDQSVDPVLWEIRRERRVELFGEGFRFNDLKRWKKGEYFNKWPLGVRVKNSDYANKLKINGGGAQGYVEYFGKPTGWLDKYYLEPLPTQDLALNKNLKQNPGY